MIHIRGKKPNGTVVLCSGSGGYFATAADLSSANITVAAVNNVDELVSLLDKFVRNKATNADRLVAQTLLGNIQQYL